MNPKISLDIFIPPGPEFSYVNVLVTDDRHGLNNGCFLIRINSWAVKLLSSVIAFHIFKPEVKLQYSEQSALEEMIQEVCLGPGSPIFPKVFETNHMIDILEKFSRACSTILVQCISTWGQSR